MITFRRAQGWLRVFFVQTQFLRGTRKLREAITLHTLVNLFGIPFCFLAFVLIAFFPLSVAASPVQPEADIHSPSAKAPDDSWYMDASGLHLVFSPGEISSFGAGFIDICIPVSSLRSKFAFGVRCARDRC